MKAKYLLILGVIVVLVIVAGLFMLPEEKEPVPSPKPLPSNFLIYENKVEGIKIGYPADWTKKEQYMESVVAFLSPKESPSDTFQENVNIIVQDLSAQPMTLEEYTELSINQIGQLVTNANIIESEATSLANNPGHKLVYTGIQGEYELKWMQIWTIKDNKAYIITYTAQIDKYSDFLEPVKQMIDSFEIL
jgi:serine/threonine-protein kinase